MTIAERPSAGTPRTYRFPRFERMPMENGLGLVVAPMPRLPLVTVTMVVDAGASVEQADQEGAAHLTARALLEGTVRSTARQLTDRLERLGAGVSVQTDWDVAALSMTVLRPQLEAALEPFAEMVLQPAFPERELARLKAERLAEIMQLRAEPRGLADEALAGAVYAARSPYAHPEGGRAESVRRLGRDDLAALHQARFRPTQSTLIMTGDITPEAAAALTRERFGAWEGQPDVSGPLDASAARSIRAVHLVERADAPQSELRLGHVGLPRTHPDYFPVLLMNAVLGGLFSSRINLNLRERHAYTYGASSSFEWRKGAGPFVVSTAVQSDVTVAAVREILGEIDAMRDRPISADELELAANYLAGVFPIRYETTSAVARALAAMVVFALPADHFDRYRDRVRAVTTDEIWRAAQRHLHPDLLQLVVVGDPAAVRAPLESLEFGPIMGYGRDGAPNE